MNRVPNLLAVDLTHDQQEMLARLKSSHNRMAETGAGGCVYVAASNRQAALQTLAERGLARCWTGEGRDAGLLIGKVTASGLDR